MEIAGAKSYKGSFSRFNNTIGIKVEDDKEKEQFRIKIDLPDTDNSEVLFTVGNIYDSIMYLQAYVDNKKICICKVCGRGFIRKSNNQKACEGECQDILHRMNQARVNEKNRKAALESKQAI